LVLRRFAEPCADFFAAFFVAEGFTVFFLATDFFPAADFAAFLAAGFAAFLAAGFAAFLAAGFAAFLAAGLAAFFLVAGFAVFLFVSALSVVPPTKATGAAALR
jgi:hypothetical protein